MPGALAGSPAWGGPTAGAELVRDAMVLSGSRPEEPGRPPRVATTKRAAA